MKGILIAFTLVATMLIGCREEPSESVEPSGGESTDVATPDPIAGFETSAQPAATVDHASATLVATLPRAALPVPHDVATSVTVEFVAAEGVGPESGASSGDGPDWAAVPAHLAIRLDGYESTNTLHDARIRVYRVDDFIAANETAADQIGALEALLASEPSGWNAGEPLPFLPLFNAAQTFRAHVAPATFSGGSGIRYVTMYSQAFIPVSNAEIFYTFQGLTDDGMSYVSAILPVRLDSLPDAVDVSTWQAPGDDYQAYLEGIASELEAIDAGDFEPSLEDLDALIGTLEVAQGEG